LSVSGLSEWQFGHLVVMDVPFFWLGKGYQGGAQLVK
jgi:hypothetical protein